MYELLRRQPGQRSRRLPMCAWAGPGLWALVAAPSLLAAAETLEPLTITATRLARPAFEVSASIDTLAIRDDTLGVNLSESLAGVAGLLARDRQNYAQDTQISVRGFGARSAFGIRGVRLYVDGIPATQPDGQGQVSHFNLASADRVEVLRGPFSALYGNSSGGVIQLFTADGAGAPALHAGAASGSFDAQRYSVGSDGAGGRWRYNAAYSHFDTDGARGHGAARRDSLQAKLGVELYGNQRLTLLYNYFDSPEAQDPLGLTRAQFDADPAQAAPASLQFNTRKNARQQQGGAILDTMLADAGALRLLGYAGHRQVTQFLAIPAATQTDPRHSGGVVDLSTAYAGAEARWSRSFDPDGRPLSLVAGLTYDRLSQQRRGYENYLGSVLGVRGALRRDEDDDVWSSDQYLQAEWSFAPRWSAQAGLRRSAVHFRSLDRYLRSGNVDDSGRAAYAATTPVASLRWSAKPALNIYAALGSGFETPTFAELAYRADGGAGLNLALRAARTRSLELGAKWRPAPAAHLEAAIFRADTRDELVVVTNSGGRSAYANAGRTRREGLELAAQLSTAARTGVDFAYTWLRARVRDAYATCSSVPCVVPTGIVAAGNRVPGVPSTSVYGALRQEWGAGWRARLEVRYLDAVPVNDLNSAAAPAYATVDVSLGREWQRPNGRVHVYLRSDNLLDRRYAGSVIVNDANARYYEPAPGRTLLLGFDLDAG